jgi:hypothetical protein
MAHPLLDDRARALITPMLQGADGILDEGWYGATANDDNPQILVLLRHGDIGIVTLYPCYQEATQWLIEKYSGNIGQNLEEVLLFPTMGKHLLTTIPGWSQIIRDAARDGVVLYAGHNWNAMLEKFTTRDEQGHPHFPGCRGEIGHGHPPRGVTPASARVTQEDGTIDDVQGVVINLGELMDNPQALHEAVVASLAQAGLPQDLLEQVTAGLPDKAPLGFTPEGRFGDRIGSAAARKNVLLAENTANRLRKSIRRILGDRLEDGVYGKPGKKAHVCAEYDARAGVVRLHATRRDDNLGVALVQALCIPSVYGTGGTVYANAVVEIDPETMQGREGGRAVLSAVAWPVLVALAESYGVTVILGTCQH